MKPEYQERLWDMWHQPPEEFTQDDREKLAEIITTTAFSKAARIMVQRSRIDNSTILGLSPLSKTEDMERLLRAQGYAEATVTLLQLLLDMTELQEQITVNTGEEDA